MNPTELIQNIQRWTKGNVPKCYNFTTEVYEGNPSVQSVTSEDENFIKTIALNTEIDGISHYDTEQGKRLFYVSFF